MSEPKTKMLDHACWISPHNGVVELMSDWRDDGFPPLFMEPGNIPLSRLARMSPYYFARRSGYFMLGDWITFALKPSDYPHIDWRVHNAYVCGDFNEWEEAVGDPTWKLVPVRVDDSSWLALNLLSQCCLDRRPLRFKFITGAAVWL